MKCPACQHDNIAGVDQCANCMSDLTAVAEATLDPVERSFNEVRLREMIKRSPLNVAPTDSVESVIRQMASQSKPCALVVYDNVVVGIFTERDALGRISADYDGSRNRPVREFMTAAPETLSADDCLAYAVNKMSVGGYRHVPITDVDEKPLGVVAVRDVVERLFEAMPESA